MDLRAAIEDARRHLDEPTPPRRYFISDGLARMAREEVERDGPEADVGRALLAQCDVLDSGPMVDTPPVPIRSTFRTAAENEEAGGDLRISHALDTPPGAG